MPRKQKPVTIEVGNEKFTLRFLLNLGDAIYIRESSHVRREQAGYYTVIGLPKAKQGLVVSLQKMANGSVLYLFLGQLVASIDYDTMLRENVLDSCVIGITTGDHL